MKHPFHGAASGQVNVVLFAMLAADPTDANAIAPEMKHALDEYGNQHSPAIGGFLYALLSNDLESAASRADPYNKITLVPLVFYVMNCLPAECHGSEAKVDAWLEKAKRNIERTRHLSRMDFPRPFGVPR